MKKALTHQDRPYTGAARTELVEHFFKGTGSTYDSMVCWATLGIDRLWKKRIVALIPEGTGPVLDLACGTGISTLAIARRFRGRRIVGVEMRDEYLAIAREKVRILGLQNIELVLCRAEDFQSPDKFDCVTSSYLAKYAELPLLTAHCRSMLKAGGLLLMHDFTLPPNRVLLALWHLYFQVMRNTVARAIPSWMPIYEGLPRLIIATRWLDELRRALEDCGFTGIRRDYLTLCGDRTMPVYGRNRSPIQRRKEGDPRPGTNHSPVRSGAGESIEILSSGCLTSH